MLSFLMNIQVKSGNEAEVLEGLSKLQKKAHQDAGCINFIWLQHKDNPYNFTLFEQWENQEYLDQHIANITNIWNSFVPYLERDPHAEELRAVSDMIAPLTEDKIKVFVETWFDKLSKHVVAKELMEMLSDTNLEMRFPETTINNKTEFLAWYEDIGRTYTEQEHILETLEIKPNSEFQRINLTVVWKAKKLSDYFSLAFRVTQSWEIMKSFYTAQPIIYKYIIESFDPVSE